MSMQIRSTSRGGAGQFSISNAVCRARFFGLNADGVIQVTIGDGRLYLCEVLEHLDTRDWQPGERLLVWIVEAGEPGVVVGRVVTKPLNQAKSVVTLEATESLTLKCGEASVELRADGRAMVKGEDVLLRAKGTQRIRAGNVAIN